MKLTQYSDKRGIPSAFTDERGQVIFRDEFPDSCIPREVTTIERQSLPQFDYELSVFNNSGNRGAVLPGYQTEDREKIRASIREAIVKQFGMV